MYHMVHLLHGMDFPWNCDCVRSASNHSLETLQRLLTRVVDCGLTGWIRTRLRHAFLFSEDNPFRLGLCTVGRNRHGNRVLDLAHRI